MINTMLGTIVVIVFVLIVVPAIGSVMIWLITGIMYFYSTKPDGKGGRK